MCCRQSDYLSLSMEMRVLTSEKVQPQLGSTFCLDKGATGERVIRYSMSWLACSKPTGGWRSVLNWVCLQHNNTALKSVDITRLCFSHFSHFSQDVVQ